MDKKYIFLDIDGTLVDFNGKMPPGALDALKAAHACGHKLVICTGRQLSQVYPWLLESVCFDAIISSSGANIRAGGRQIARHCIEPMRLRALTEYFNGTGTPYCIQTQDALLLEGWCSDLILSYFNTMGIDRAQIDSIFGRIDLIDDASTTPFAEKLLYYNANKELDEIERDIGDFFQVVRYSFGNSPATNGEITCRRYNKATGMAELLSFFNASRDDTVAIGDGDNDLEMITYASCGVAMGNATPALKAAADMLTDDIDEDGLANALKKLRLI